MNILKNGIVTNTSSLHRISRATSWEEVNDLHLVDKMKEAMKESWTKGYGLAAIQIGQPLQFAWFNLNGEDIFLLNAKILGYGKTWKTKTEGCLSIPDTWTMVQRAYKVKIESDGKVHKLRGLTAQIVQHEIDHMNGILVTDRKGE